MPTAICPRCQSPLVAKTPYLRIYVRDDDEHESYVRIHLECPRPAPDESPNLASPPSGGQSMQAMQGGGTSPMLAAFPRWFIALTAAVTGNAVLRQVVKSRK